MKIIFMGTPDFAVPSLEILLQNNYTISAVVTAPDKPRGRGQQVSFTPIKECALKHSLPLLQPDSLKDPTFIAELADLKPDLFVIVAFKILPKEVFTIPSKGAFNLHASLLPKYRGAAPINWAIINGEKESGVTTFFLREKVDTGNIILQQSVAITDEMNAESLHDSLSEVGSRVVLKTVQMIENGNVEPVAQNDSIASPAPKLFKENLKINWNQSTESIHNFVRGLSPYPAAWTVHNNTMIKIFKTGRTSVEIQELGVGINDFGGVALKEKKLFVKTADSFIEILELQQEGKKRMNAEEFLRGYKLVTTDRFS